MNAKTLIAGLITTIAAAGAFANDQFNGEAYNPPPQANSSKVTRSEVKNELAQAQAAGLVAYGDAGYKTPKAVSTKTRAEVRAEFLQARANGEIAYGEGAYKTPYAFPGSNGQAHAEALKPQSHADEAM